MCIKRAAKLSVLCLVPGATGLLMGAVTSYSLTAFIGILVAVVAAVAYYAGLRYRVAGRGSHCADCPEVETSAGVFLALSFLFGYWSGLGLSSGHGLFVDALLLCALTGLLAAFVLTVVKNVVDGRYVWLNTLLDKVFPDRGVATHNNDASQVIGKQV